MKKYQSLKVQRDLLINQLMNTNCVVPCGKYSWDNTLIMQKYELGENHGKDGRDFGWFC
jgi:hypothetical protein